MLGQVLNANLMQHYAGKLLALTKDSIIKGAFDTIEEYAEFEATSDCRVYPFSCPKKVDLLYTQSLVEEAVIDYFGHKCLDFEPECMCCQAWAELEFLKRASIEVSYDTSDVYCQECGSCGEPGCCPPEKCKYFAQYNSTRKQLELEEENLTLAKKVEVLEEFISRLFMAGKIDVGPKEVYAKAGAKKNEE